MFRAYIFLLVKGMDPSPRLTSSPVDTQDDALFLMDTMMEFPFATGGDIEQNVPGIGWVVVDEVETVQILARRQEPKDDADVLSFIG